jgi:hypothetical protein
MLIRGSQIKPHTIDDQNLDSSASYHVTDMTAFRNVDISDSSWNTGHLVMGNYHLWVDASANLRMNPNTPTADTDGTAFSGITGIQGPTGIQGLQGDTGMRGIEGETGVQGETGVAGETGIQGVAGSTGPEGIQGATGYQGVAGETGVPGRTGVQGTTGLMNFIDSTGFPTLDGVTPVLLWNMVDEALYAGVTGVGHWVQISAGALQGATGIGLGATGVQGATGIGGGGPGGDSTYSNATPTPSTLGGIAAGTTFSGQTMSQMWDALLYPYQNPAFTSFAISGQTTSIEVGATTVANPTFTWATSNSSNVSPSTVAIIDVTAGNTTLASGLPNTSPYQVTHAAWTNNSATSQQFRIQATNTHSVLFNTTTTITWYWKRYYGESTTTPLVENDIEALRVGALASGFAGTYAFNAGGYKYLSFPSSFGTATTFKDVSTNLGVPFEAPYTVSVTNVNGVVANYSVYRSTNIINGSISIAVS